MKDLFTHHYPRLEQAIQTCSTREAWSPFIESPSRRLHPEGAHAQLLFPDHSGETFDGLWITRTLSKTVSEQLNQRKGTLLFLRQNLTQPIPLSEVIAMETEMLAAMPADSVVREESPATQDWRAEASPDQVKLVDTLQVLSSHFKVQENEKLAIFVSAWDKAPANTSPEGFVKNEMPLLYQYLKSGNHNFDLRFYGVSAQGGEYLAEQTASEISEELSELLSLDTATSRIRLIHESDESHDLAKPIHWLMS